MPADKLARSLFLSSISIKSEVQEKGRTKEEQNRTMWLAPCSNWDILDPGLFFLYPLTNLYYIFSHVVDNNTLCVILQVKLLRYLSPTSLIPKIFPSSYRFTLLVWSCSLLFSFSSRTIIFLLPLLLLLLQFNVVYEKPLTFIS